MSTLSERYELLHEDNPVVFFDITIGGHSAGRILMELFAHILPKTSENFRIFCTGELRNKDGKAVGYKDCSFHRLIKDFMIQAGDFVNNDGTGRICIYGHSPESQKTEANIKQYTFGDKFDDESFHFKHNQSGLLSMANSGPNTNGCQFFITCNNCEWLNGKHVVFGRVIEGLLTVRKLENVATGAQSKPKLPCIISQCGQM